VAVVTVFDDVAGSIIAVTTAAPSETWSPRISVTAPVVMPVRTATSRITDPS